METYAHVAQIAVALAVGYVWIFRFDNIVLEFRQYGLSDLTRTMVGASKIILATLIVAGIWYPALVLVPAIIMGLLMVGAQFYHFQAHNQWRKHVPSLVLLLLCVFIAFASLKNIN